MNRIHGVIRRPCICSRPACASHFRAYAKADDRKRVGYFQLPDFAHKEHTDRGKIVNACRDSMYFHAVGHGHKAPRKKGHTYVAYHHFPIKLLQDNNKGPIVSFDPNDFPALSLKIGKHDKIKYGPEKGRHYAVPCNAWANVVTEVGQMFHRMSEPEGGMTPTAPPSAGACAALPPPQDQPALAPPRVTPNECRTQSLVRQAKTFPDAMAHEFEILKKTLSVQYGGLSRATLTSREWHALHPEAANILFGNLADGYGEIVIFIMKGLDV